MLIKNIKETEKAHMRKLTPQEQQWIKALYPLVNETMKKHDLTERETTDWHGELSVALCEAIIELSPDIPPKQNKAHFTRYSAAVTKILNMKVHSILQYDQHHIKEDPSGLRPSHAAERGHDL